MGIFDAFQSSARETVGDVVGRADADEHEAGTPFPRKFTTRHFDHFGGSATENQYSRVATYVCPSGTRVAWGYGSASKEANQGYLYVDLRNAADESVEGTFRLAQTSPTERNKLVVADFDTNELKGDRSDRKKQVPLPEQVDKPIVKQDSKLVVEFEPEDGSAEIDATNSEISLPVTEYDLNR